VHTALLAPGMKASVNRVHRKKKRETAFNRVRVQPRRVGTNSRQLGPSWDQNSPFYGLSPQVEQRKGNRIIGIYGAGDGNRTHVRSLGSLFYKSRNAQIGGFFFRFSKSSNGFQLEHGRIKVTNWGRFPFPPVLAWPVRKQIH
jgi:hypothetical protein